MRSLFSFVLIFFIIKCAGDIQDVDRTQPGKIKKSIFSGDWYYRQTVVDAPYTIGVTFVGEQSILELVRFEISKDYLTAYRTYEHILNSEIPGNLEGQEYQGSPIASFKIESHFDVIREYNAQTGEQTNIIVENDTDRPWYEREYIRVLWDQNLLANFNFLAGSNSFGNSVSVQEASYVVNDPKNPDAPVFGVKNSDKWIDHRDPFIWGKLDTIDYFDLTHKLQITPETLELDDGYGNIQSLPACWFYFMGPWDCASQTIKIRSSFLKKQTNNYEPLHYPDNYIARDSEGEAIRRSCEFENNACFSDNCDTLVRIPMFDRFGYFRTERDVYDRDYEITETGRIYLANRFNIWQESTQSNQTIPYEERSIKPIIYYLSENFPENLIESAEITISWWDNAFKETMNSLGKDASSENIVSIKSNTYKVDENFQIIDFGQRNGDLRYNHIYWVHNPQADSILGYGPSATDPLTGEIIAADSYIYGASIDSYAAYATDIIELLRGDISETDFIEGENVSRAIFNMNQSHQSAEKIHEDIRKIMDNGLNERLHSLQNSPIEQLKGNSNVLDSRFDLADNDEKFSGLWNQEIRQALETKFGKRLKPSEFSGRRLEKAWKLHQKKLAQKTIYIRSFEDNAILNLVNNFLDLNHEQIFEQLQKYIFQSITAHELGHNLGLRHNFAGSTDALNYHDEYWNIRNSQASTLTLPTKEEETEGIREYSYASIMDYGSKFISDIHGIGKYDIAAIKFGYGQLVETFVNPPDWQEHDLLLYTNIQTAIEEYLHYLDLPKLFSSNNNAEDGIQNMRTRRDVPLSSVIAWMTESETSTEDFTDAIVPYRFCSDEYDGATWSCSTFDEGADPYEIVNYAIENYENYYIFKSFKRNRRYIDPYNYYLNSYFRTFLPILSQYQYWLLEGFDKSFDWECLYEEDVNAQFTTEFDWNLDSKGGLSGAAASVAAINFLAKVITTPEPGSYLIDPDTNLLFLWDYSENRICTESEDSWVDDCVDMYVPLDDGRYAYTLYNQESGYYWYERPFVIGSYWDKLNAIETLTDPSTFFLSTNTTTDLADYIIGFNIAFPHAINTLLGSIISFDYAKFAPQMIDGNLEIPNYLSDVYDNTILDRTGVFVDPTIDFNLTLDTIFYSMAFLSTGFDQTFINHAKIWISGSSEEIEYREDSILQTFTNPFNNRIYKAIKSPDPKHYSLGYEILLQAQNFADRVENENCTFTQSTRCANLRYELQNRIDNIELLRSYYNIFGYL